MAIDKVVDSTVLDGYFSDIADAIRDKDGTQNTYTPAEMAQAIEDIPTGGGIPQVLLDLMEGTASGSVTLSGITDMTGIRVMLGANDGMNPVTELHCPDVTKWGHRNSNYATKMGGIIDCTESTGNAGAKLQALDLPKCKSLYINNPRNIASNPVFSKLTTMNVPALERLFGCLKNSSLTSFNAPNLVEMTNGSLFRDASSLREVRVPKFGGGVASYEFFNCTALELADLGKCTGINTSFMGTCTSLKALVLRGSSRCSLSSSTDLNNTPIASGTGYIYVPRDLIAAYQADTNWSTFAGQFRALEDYTDGGTIDGEFIMPTA